ncbi:FecR family protein [Lacibacter sediminis]|uniref:FecR domain-containing protein n=1 Tax=Lacibacter sediminis TaxID=2760713 RepID=A0A7G5XE04_9BACT|nr:FecR family protein [Lacibacter sediminis]QNA43707.1 FecR domain-containing protein [Lacibacter sediminis]
MTDNKENLSDLIHKYLDNRLTSAEYAELWRLLNEQPDETQLNEELKQLWLSVKTDAPLIAAADWDQKIQEAKQKLSATFETDEQPVIGRFARFRWVAAAAILLLILSSVFLLTNQKEKNTTVAKNTQPQLHQDHLPGGDRAVLTLADGSSIVLDSAGNGMLAQQGTTEIIKKEDGQLLYNSQDNATEEIAYNLLQTPRGGQYKITLPDGSKVWLNAASSLKYPVVFSGKERRVEITGEAYFEIAKDALRPFKVQLNQMEVEVLGTHFNINSYTDEETVRTTLLEGRVKVTAASESKFLQPGQQAQLKPSGNMKIVNDANLEETVAWKDGNFQFENSDIKSVMRQLSRWYDVEISYQGNISTHFIGGISRNVKLSQVLSMLQQTGEVRFIIEGKKIIVMP